MNQIEDVLLTYLAASRISRFITEDYLFEPVRNRVVGIHEKLDYFVTCPACTSVYTGLIATKLPRWIKVALAASEATILTRALENRI